MAHVSADAHWAEVNGWRKDQRALLIARREAATCGARQASSTAITAAIEAGFPMLAGMVIGFCWPFKSEFDARFAIRSFRALAAIAALPEVVAKGSPLRFRKWWPGAAMTPGVWGIPSPTGTAIVVPDALLVPLNGFDAQGYRLGYGGGYFDATLATIRPQPLAIGVGFELARLATIRPQAHDIAMDFIVTEAGLHAPIDGVLTRIDAAACESRARALCDARGLPRRQLHERSYSSPPCYAGEFEGGADDTGAQPGAEVQRADPRGKSV